MHVFSSMTSLPYSMADLCVCFSIRPNPFFMFDLVIWVLQVVSSQLPLFTGYKVKAFLHGSCEAFGPRSPFDIKYRY